MACFLFFAWVNSAQEAMDNMLLIPPFLILCMVLLALRKKQKDGKTEGTNTGIVLEFLRNSRMIFKRFLRFLQI